MSIIIIIVIIIVVKAIKENENINQNKKYTNTNLDDVYTSTLNNSKKQAYNNLNTAHRDHKVDKYDDNKNTIDTKKIGYKKCPNCGNTVSITSKECFMCDYNFKDNEK